MHLRRIVVGIAVGTGVDLNTWMMRSRGDAWVVVLVGSSLPLVALSARA